MDLSDRKRVINYDIDENVKRMCIDKSPLETFMCWCKSNSIILNEKVEITQQGSCAQYGMLAVKVIEKDECLAEIPRNIVLSPMACEISNFISSEEEMLGKSESGWVSILLALMFEYKNPKSRWRAYMDLVPDFSSLNLPMFWKNDKIEKELKGTGIPEAVSKDLNGIETEFNNYVLPFVMKYSEYFDVECRSIEFYKKMVAFLMAYSFTEPSDEITGDESDSEHENSFKPQKITPFMVPVADILNHIAKNNARLDFGEESLKIVSVQRIASGEEIFNTYGEIPNWQLLQMYGFAEAFPKNHYDSVDIASSIFYKAAKELQCPFLEEKWKFLTDSNIIQDDSSFVLGCEGVLTEEETYATLKILAFDQAQFDTYKENDGWSDDEDNSQLKDSLQFSDISNLPVIWRKILHRVTNIRLSSYGTSLEMERGVMQSNSWNSLSKGEQYCCHIRLGQLELLQKLLIVSAT